MSTEGTVNDIYINKPKEEVLLQTAERLKPENVSKALEAIDLPGNLFEGGKLTVSAILFLQKVKSYATAAWTPITTFLSFISSFSATHLKFAEVDNRINDLKSSLTEYSNFANELCFLAKELIKLSTLDLTGMEISDAEKEVFKGSVAKLTEVYNELYSLKELGEKLLKELNSLPELEQKFREQHTTNSIHIADELKYLIKLGEFATFNSALSNVRSTIAKLEK